MAHLAFVGLGNMGTGMALRLIGAGHEVTVWNRTVDAADSLVAAGATRAANPEDAFSAEVVFSMLAHDRAAEAVFTAEVLATAAAGSTHVNMATVSVAAADRLAALHEAAGIGYVAAPVLGLPKVAAAGQLNIVAAGEPAVIAAVQPYLDLLGKRTWPVGATPSMANLVKIGVNYNIIHAIQALAESVTLLENGGVAGNDFLAILTDVAFTGTIYPGYGRLISEKLYSPSFPVVLGLKDLTLAEQAAEQNGTVLLSAPVLRDAFERALADPELAELDWSVIAEVTRGLSTPSLAVAAAVDTEE
jgi:3-hydroxyisobutyrate dehydrogenase-like beta-hydroxyacid dehydrogenase